MQPKGNFAGIYTPMNNGQALVFDPTTNRYVDMTIEGKLVQFEDINPADTPRMPTKEWCNFSIEKAEKIAASFAPKIRLAVDNKLTTPVLRFYPSQESEFNISYDIADFMLLWGGTGDRFAYVRRSLVDACKLAGFPIE